LKYKGAKSQLIALFTTDHNILKAEPVALAVLVASPYTAVVAVLLAVVGKFNKSTDVNILAVVFYS
jgi:hypothetical protein